MTELFWSHIYFYIPFGIAFLALYFRVIELIFNFQWSNLGRTLSRFIYVILFGSIGYNTNIAENWFSIISIGTLVLLGDELLYFCFKKRRRERLIREITSILKKELTIP